MPDVPTKVTEELAAAPIAAFIRDLGLAVAEANSALAKSNAGADLIYTINCAEIEVNVAISMEQTKTTGVDGGLKLSVFSVNASYKSTFAFKEEASSKIKIVLEAKPKPAAGPQP